MTTARRTTSAVVVGGGIAGLAAAWELRKRGADVAVVEASNRLGGKIRTTEFAGHPVDEGADAFLARVPAAAELAGEVGLGDALVRPATGHASLWIGDRLVPIPGGHVLGVPVDVDAVAAAGILSDAALERARQEPHLAGEPLGADEDVAVGELVARRFGPEVHELLVDPLLGGINAGRSEELSIEVGAVQLAVAARRHASLTRGLLALRQENPPDATAPVFFAPAGGMQRLVDALVEALRADGVAFWLGDVVDAIEPGEQSRYRVVAGGDTLAAEAVVVAAPAFAAARLLRPRSATAAKLLADVEYASVALVTLAYEPSAFDRPPVGSGFLVPRTQGRLLTAASVFSNKWPALAGPDAVIVRASVGRFGDDAALDLPDDELVERVAAELSLSLAIHGPPFEVRVSRWSDAFPQFRPGHLTRMAEVDAALAADAPGIAVAGAAMRGVGIPTCILSARAAVDRIHPA